MINRLVVGTNQLEQARQFYDEILSLIGMKQVWTVQNGVGWAPFPNSPTFAVFSPFNNSEATSGNGTMTAFKAANRKQVDQVHRKAIKLGGANEGDPGERSPGFYAGYFRDLDMNKVCICHVELNNNDIAQADSK